MIKPVLVAALAAGVAVVLRKRSSAKADAALWAQATATTPR
jgi:hypothetical protein